MEKQTILWADDDQDDLMIMREVLAEIDHSFEIIEVYNGQEALDHLYDLKQNGLDFPCLVILDINMPVMSGKEALVRMKDDEVLKHIPVVVFTTSSSEMDRIFCRQYGVTMISKPPSFETLHSEVEKLLNFCKS